MIVVAILLTWIVIGASYYWLGNARLVVSNLSTVQAPNLAQTSRLSAQTTDIAMLSNRILSEGSTSSSNLEALLKTSVSELIAFIAARTAKPILVNGRTHSTLTGPL